MAEATPAKKIEAVKALELPAPVQEGFKVDLSFEDKIPKNAKKYDAKQILCWYGALPAVGPVATWKADRFNNIVRAEDTSAIAAWTDPARMSEWHGKCQWFQNISIRGLMFPAFTGYSQRSGFESPNQAQVFSIAKAGAVGLFTEDQIQEILFECTHTRVAPAENPRAPHTAEIFRLTEEPEGSGNWIHPSNIQTGYQNTKKYFDPEIHRPVADFVYFMKIQNEFQQQDVVSIMKNPLPSLSGR